MSHERAPPRTDLAARPRPALHRHGGAEGRERARGARPGGAAPRGRRARGRRPGGGGPGAGAPPSPAAAAEAALRRGGLGYTEALGLPSLRARIARHYGEWYGLDVDPRRVAVTAGASGAFVLAFLATFDAGDRVVVPEPGYPAYRNILRALDVEVVPLPVDAAERFQPTVERLQGLDGPLHGLILASPANPTGTMLRAAELEGLAAFCAGRGLRLVVDEIYHGIAYEDRPGTVLGVAPDAILVNSFSKYFCMTGWRLGWLVLPEALVGPVERLAQNLFISPPTIAQHAALGAFDDQAELDRRIAGYRANRDRLVAALRRAGLGRPGRPGPPPRAGGRGAGSPPPTAPSTSTSTSATWHPTRSPSAASCWT